MLGSANGQQALTITAHHARGRSEYPVGGKQGGRTEMGELVRGNLRLKTIVGAGSALIALAVTTPAMLASTSAHAAAPVGPVALEVADFYRSRGGAPLWFGPNAGAAAPSSS